MKILFSPSETKIAGGKEIPFDKNSFIFPELFEKRMEIVKQYNDFILNASKEELIKLFGTKKECLHQLQQFKAFQELKQPMKRVTSENFMFLVTNVIMSKF